MERFRYFVINKPFGVLSQFTKEGKYEALGSLYDFPGDVYPVGRLDAESEGLLIITNDPSINNKLLNPAHGHLREYLIQVEGLITTEALEQLKIGVTLNIRGKQHLVKALECEEIDPPEIPERDPPVRFRKTIPTSWLRLVIDEGKNRQVRKMTAAVNLPTLRLIRFAIEGLTLDHLSSETVSEISGKDLKTLIFNS
jgi:23S rRNA pseudouridine2457 synthase